MLKKTTIINDFERSSQTYFKEIGEFAPLSRQEEYSLWERYKKNNDLTARDRLIKANLRFVASIAKSYQGLGLSYSDLIAEGNCGLMKAMEKFDYEKGYKTISYSVWWIRQSILEALHERNSIKGDDLPKDFEKPVADDDVADAPTQDNDFIDETYDALKYDEERKAISLLVNCLSEREREVISDYYGLDNRDSITLEEIGDKMGLTKERVRQIKEKALNKLRSEALKNSITNDIYK